MLWPPEYFTNRVPGGPLSLQLDHISEALYFTHGGNMYPAAVPLYIRLIATPTLAGCWLQTQSICIQAWKWIFRYLGCQVNLSRCNVSVFLVKYFLRHPRHFGEKLPMKIFVICARYRDTYWKRHEKIISLYCVS